MDTVGLSHETWVTKIMIKCTAVRTYPPGTNKGRLCNTIASVALVHTSIKNDLRMQTKEILSSRRSKQTKLQSCSETSTANSRLVRAKGGF